MVSVRALVRRLQAEAELTVRAVRGTIAVRRRARAERRADRAGIGRENGRLLIWIAGLSAALGSVVAVVALAALAKTPMAGPPSVTDEPGEDGGRLPRDELGRAPFGPPFRFWVDSVDPADPAQADRSGPIVAVTTGPPALAPAPGETTWSIRGTTPRPPGGLTGGMQGTPPASPQPAPSVPITATTHPTPEPSVTFEPTGSPSPTGRPTIHPPPW